MTKLINDDNLSALKSLSDGSVHLSVTSPPYDSARTYSGFPPLTLGRIKNLGKELYRVLTPQGVLVWNVGDMSDGKGGQSLTSFRQALIFQKIGFRVRPMIWEKLSFIPEKNFYYNIFEYVFVCFKNKGYTFNPIEDIEIGNRGSFWGKYTKREKDGSFVESEKQEYRKKYEEKIKQNPYRKRGTVWKGKTAAQEKPCKKLYGHAPMPEWLASDLIKSFSNKGDLVLDPFHGGGTTAKCALELERDYIGIEISSEIMYESLERLSQIQTNLI